jgi:glycolate oxidase iron-sulfur subunit
MKDYQALFADDPAWASRAAALTSKTRDLAEFLIELGPLAVRHPLPITIAYHDACHLAHAQGIRIQPRELLSGIPELQLKEIGDPEICCGSAGIYNLLQPEAANELGDRKATSVRATKAELLVAANPGCALQIATALHRQDALSPGNSASTRRMQIAHTAEVLDVSLRGAGRESLMP